jgi:asparagine synthetase B (glutamine-hydrolysing)
MCGIISSYNKSEVESGLEILTPRGRDHQSIQQIQDYYYGHVLHSIVGHVEQPITNEDKSRLLIANCEIYNWESIADEYGIQAKNDADLLFQLLNKESLSVALELLDGVYAFIYKKDNIIIATRDLLGVKPLFYTKEGSFSSENKALNFKGEELNPRKILYYDLETKKTFFQDKNFYSLAIKDHKEEDAIATFSELFLKAVSKRIPDKNIKVGVLLSGGVDSTLIAYALKELGVETICYTASFDNPDGEDPHDLIASKKVAKEYNLTHKIISATKEDIPRLTKEVASSIETSDAVKVAVGIPFYICAQEAIKDGCKVLFSGLGAEEIMAGYQRHKVAEDINEECLRGLLGMHERDLYRDDILTMHQGIELRLPFLDRALIEFSLSVSSTLKIKDEHSKYLLRKSAQAIGLKEEDAFRPKKAAQYGSRFDRALKKVANTQGMKRSEYIQSLIEK